jgi:hypothetical protein
MERNGSYFHRSANIMLQQAPIKVLNIREFDDLLDVVSGIGISTIGNDDGNQVLTSVPYTNYFNTDRNWFVDLDNVVPSNDTRLLHIVNLGSKDLTVFVRPLKSIDYRQSVGEYFNLLGIESPEYLEETMMLNDTFVEVFVFNLDLSYGIPSSLGYLFNGTTLKNDTVDSNGTQIDALQQLSLEGDSNFLASYKGSLIPTLATLGGSTLAIDDIINNDSDTTGLISKINEDILDVASDFDAPSFSELETVASASALTSSERKRPISFDFYATNDIDWVGSSLSYTIGQEIDSMSLNGANIPLTFNSLSNDDNQITSAYGIEGGLVSVNEGISSFNHVGGHYIHTNPMLLGTETPKSGDFEYNRATSNVTINGKNYNPQYNAIFTNITGIKNGTLFVGQDGNPTKVISLDFLGSKEVFGGLHTSTFPLDSNGSALGTFNSTTSNWEYIGGTSASLPVEYNYSVAVNDPKYGFPLNEVGGTVIDYPSANLSDSDIDALIVANPTFATTVNYFIATFDRPLYQGDVDAVSQTSIGARSNTSVLTLDNSLELILYRELDENYMIQLNRIVEKTSGFTPISMNGMASRDAQFVNGTSTRLEEILNGTVGGELLNLIKDRDYESFNYLVDSFSSYPTANIKSQLTNAASKRGGCTALINMPFVKGLKDSTNPYFKDSTSSTKVNLEYLEDGGNTQLPYSQLFSLPTKQQGASFGATYFPNVSIVDNGKTIKFPIAPIVSNLFASKWQQGSPHLPIFGFQYKVSASGLGKVGKELTDEERAILEGIGINPILQDFIVLGNKSLNQDGTALKSLHVRETLNVLQEEFRPLAKSLLGKYNTEQNRANAKARFESVLERYLGNGSLSYAKVIVDKSNNTDEVISNQMMLIDVELVVTGINEKVVVRSTVFNSENEIGTTIVL